MQEKQAFRFPGFLALAVVLGLAAGACWKLVAFLGTVSAFEHQAGEVVWGHLWWFLALALLAGVVSSGIAVVKPNEARVVVFFGRYLGTLRQAGYHFTCPLSSRPEVSVKVRNFISEKLKVNDAHGNPIEIAAVVVWQVADIAKAPFDVDSYVQFVATQAETAIRSLASRFPYDAPENEQSLRGDPEGVAVALRHELQERLRIAGVHVLEACLSHLAYAPEIAQAMLRRQQAQAIVIARQRIVDGAVGMVKMALEQLREQGVVALDEERKAAMVNNLLVALVSESQAQPVVNAGSLH
jgi:regulator of protease activity HflC (stomatin/prohibitin superfamily)